MSRLYSDTPLDDVSQNQSIHAQVRQDITSSDTLYEYIHKKTSSRAPNDDGSGWLTKDADGTGALSVISFACLATSTKMIAEKAQGLNE